MGNTNRLYIKRRIVIQSLLLFIVTVVDSQTLLTGRVVSGKSHEPLIGVSVVAQDKFHKPVAYALTKKDGTFTVKVANGKIYESLTFSLLGYTKQSFKENLFQNGQTVVMKEEQYQLQEVEVKSRRPYPRRDTLTYNVARYSHKQDRSIADAIAKMPGLEVTGDGLIKYQGKAISHFYIEGMDLMGKHYAMVSENLSVSKVKEVQVLTNYQDIKTLREAKFSDRTALNLVLEDDAKGLWTGLLEAGMGTTTQKSDADRLLRDGRLMGMIFGGRMQSLSMYKWNNTGKNIQEEIRNLVNDSRNIENIPNITPDITLDAPDLMGHRYLMNDSRLLATNWLQMIGKDGSIRLQLSGYLDQNEGNRLTETVYSATLGKAVMTEREHGKTNASEWKGELEYKYNSSRLYVSNVVGAYLDLNNSMAETQLNGISLRQEARPHRRWISDNIQIVKSLDNNCTLRLNGYAGYQYQPGTLLLADMTTQHVDQHDTEASIDLVFQHKLFHRLNISYLAGFNYSRQKFSVWRDETASQSDSHTLLNSHVKPSLSMKSGSLTYNASVDLRLINRHFNGRSDVTLVAEPSFSLFWKMKAKLQTRLSYDFEFAPSSLVNMTLIPLFRNYRSCTTGTGEFNMFRKHKGLVKIEYSDPLIGLFFFFDGMLAYQNRMPIYNSFLSGVIYHREAIGTYANNHTWQLKGRVSKSMGSMKFLMAVNGDMKVSHYVAMTQGLQLAFRSDVYETGVYFSLQPLDFLSLEEKSQYLYNKRSCLDNHLLDSPTLRAFKHCLKLFLTPGKWQLRWTHDIYHSNDHSVSFTYFSDIQLSFRTKTYEIGLSVGNLFGNKNYDRRITEEDATVCVQNSLRPREVMIKGCLSL